MFVHLFFSPRLFTYFSLLENRDGHIVGLIEAKPEVLGTIYPYRKDVILRSTILYSSKFSVGAIVKAL